MINIFSVSVVKINCIYVFLCYPVLKKQKRNKIQNKKKVIL